MSIRRRAKQRDRKRSLNEGLTTELTGNFETSGNYAHRGKGWVPESRADFRLVAMAYRKGWKVPSTTNKRAIKAGLNILRKNTAETLKNPRLAISAFKMMTAACNYNLKSI